MLQSLLIRLRDVCLRQQAQKSGASEPHRQTADRCTGPTRPRLSSINTHIITMRWAEEEEEEEEAAGLRPAARGCLGSDSSW